MISGNSVFMGLIPYFYGFMGLESVALKRIDTVWEADSTSVSASPQRPLRLV